ncbi:MAG: NAD(P)H-hydrate dehydratase [Candidatus Aenigmatarchaeota archaeon]
MKTVTKEILKKIYKTRHPWSHKGNFGKVLVVGGSKKYTGAPTLVGLAALKAGADLVTVVAPERAANVAANFPDLVSYPIKGEMFNKWHVAQILELAKEADSLIIGNGLGKNNATVDFVLSLLNKVELPCIIDADAIHAFKNKIMSLKPNHVLTPHSFEFFTLTGLMPGNKIEHRIKFVRQITNNTKTTILLKGSIDVISNGRQLLLNKTGNPYMSVGGTGDSLVGICGALLARGVDTLDAASAAAYINGAAGDFAYREKGVSLCSTDVINNIYKVLK